MVDKMNVKIDCKHPKDKNELTVKRIIMKGIEQYGEGIPILSNHVIVDKYSIPHSHPILTINTDRLQKDKHPELSILALFIHENLHWFEEKHLSKEKEKLLQTEIEPYFRNDVKNVFHHDMKSYVQHVVVNWNEINILEHVLKGGDVDYILNVADRRYKPLDILLRDGNNFKTFKKILKSHQLIWRKY